MRMENSFLAPSAPWDLTVKSVPDRLPELIERARHYVMTPEQMRAQRISFIYGQMSGEVSKEYIAQRLESWGGLG